MITIQKYQLLDKKVQRVCMPEGATILYAREQRGDICIWAEVDPAKPTQERVIEIYGTGHYIHTDIGIDRKYLGSAHLEGGGLIFHVYERIS